MKLTRIGLNFYKTPLIRKKKNLNFLLLLLVNYVFNNHQAVVCLINKLQLLKNNKNKLEGERE
jgi:hypothetical protein